MSRSLRVQIKLFTKEDLKRFGLSLLGTELNHNKMMNQKMEVKRFSSAGFLAPAVSLNQFLTGAEVQRHQSAERGCDSHAFNDKQRAALESLGTAAGILGHKAEVKSLASVGEAIPVEFFIPPRKRERVAIGPSRLIGGRYET